MGRYITQSDLENFWGTANISDAGSWADLNNDGNSTTITDTITAAITAGEDLIDDFLRGSRYAVPISGSAKTSGSFKLYCSVFAGFVLYMRRGLLDTDETNKVTSLKNWADGELRLIVSGMRRLDATLSHSGPTAPYVVGGRQNNKFSCCPPENIKVN